MASPAFIYAFDSLGPDRFVELCGLLLGARYRGFLLTGPGADGGVDAESSPSLGELLPEAPELLLEDSLQSGELVLFQFKHKVVARTGQASARRQLLDLYRSSVSRDSELNRDLVAAKRPKTYVLVTNVEVTSTFRESFREICSSERPDIENFEVIGLDDLQGWVTLERHLRAQFFPMIFGNPKFELSIALSLGNVFVPDHAGVSATFTRGQRLLEICVMNVGEAVSYIDRIRIKALIDGKVRYLLRTPFPPGTDPLGNPEMGSAIQPGQSLSFRWPLDMLEEARRVAEDFLLVEVMVWDQIENLYVAPITQEIRDEVSHTCGPS